MGKKISVDTTEFEGSSGGYDGEQPKRGVYTAELVGCHEHTSGGGSESIAWIFEITEGDYKGWRGWIYSNMDASLWRTQEIVLAINGGKKGKMDIEPADSAREMRDSKTVKKAKQVRIRTNSEDYEGEKRARIRTVLPLDPEAAVTSDDPMGTAKKRKKKKGDDPF